MKRCFGYIRVSTQKQGEGVSLEAQKEAIQAFSERNEIAICQWFEEKVTAAKKGRPLFNAMVRQLKQGKAQGLVVHKIDRSARNFADWAKIGDLADMGVDIHFATESLDFRSRGGRLTADIQAVIAADYVRNLREETIKGMMGRLKQGLYPWGAPIGYLNNGGGKPKTPDPVRAPLIKKAFNLYGSGQHSLRSLRMELDKLGLRNENGRPISKHGIETILINPFYCGIIRVKTLGQVYEGIHKPLISVSLFERVQEIKSGKCGKKVTKHNHTYRGLFRCGLCDAPMTPEKQKGHVYYRCQTPDCVTKTVREEKIEQSIVDVLVRCKMSKSNEDKFLIKLEKWFEMRKKTELKSETTPMLLAKVLDRIELLTDALIDRLIDQETFNVRKQSLLLEKAKLEEVQAKTAKKLNDREHVLNFLELIKSLVDNYVFAKPAEKRQLVELATSNRKISKKNIYLEPANWLTAIEMLADVPFGDHHHPTSRRSKEIQDQHVEDLIEVSSEFDRSVGSLEKAKKTLAISGL